MAHNAAIDQHVQAELFRRVGLLASRSSIPALAADIDMIRRIAQQNGMLPVGSVAHALESALARGETGPLVTNWISLLHEAVGSERQDRSASDSFLAACSVRLNG